MGRKIVVVLFIILLVSCTKESDINYNHLIEKDGMEALLMEFENESMDYRILEITSDILRGSNTNIGLLDEDMLEIYEYDDAEKLEADVNAISRDGYSITYEENGSMTTTNYSWVSTPNFYLYQNTIIVYIGNNSTIQSMFNRIKTVRINK